MMLTVLILIILIGGFLIGLRQGLVFQAVHVTGLIAALAVAYLYFQRFAAYLTWIPSPGMLNSSSEIIYHQVIAFVLLFAGVKIVWNILGSAFAVFAELPVLNLMNRWLGGAFGFMKIYVVIFLLLSLVSFTPLASAQETVSNSELAQTMLDQTPVLSDKKEEFLG